MQGPSGWSFSALRAVWNMYAAFEEVDSVRLRFA